MWQFITICLAALGLVLIIVGARRKKDVPANLGIAMFSGAIISLFIFIATNDAEDRRAAQAASFEQRLFDLERQLEDERDLRVNRQEHTRFVRTVVSAGQDAVRRFDQLDLRGQLLNGLDLRRASLNEARLTEATLYNAQLGGSDLMDAHLECTRMFDASFVAPEGTQTLLRRAFLQGADMRMVDFGNADLTGAHFGRLSGYAERADVTDLRGANLSGVVGLDADWGDGVIYNVDGELKTLWPPNFTPPPSVGVPDPSDPNQGPRCRPFQFRLPD